MTAPVSPQRRTRIQALNRQVILDAALDVFAAYGFRGSTIDQIAEQAGMSKANLLYYFRRKEDVYACVLEAILTSWLEPLERLDPEGDPMEEIANYIRLKLNMSRQMPAASRLFANEMLQGAPTIGDFLRGPLRSLVEGKAEVIRGWIAEGRLKEVDPTHLIFMIWATTQHYADFDVQVRAVLGAQAQPAGHFVAAEQTILRVFLEGLKPRQ